MRQRKINVGEHRVKALMDLKHLIDNKRLVVNSDFCGERNIDRGFIYMLETQGVISKISRGNYKWNLEGEMTPNDAEALLQIVLEKYYAAFDDRAKDKRERVRNNPPLPPAQPAPYKLNGTVSPASVLSPYKIVHYEEVGEVEGYVVLKVLAFRRPPITPQASPSQPQSQSF
jgi:hypothetical protein